MKIAMANDHAGTQMKEEIKAYLLGQGYEVEDFGTYDNESCDLSDFVYPAALAVARGECDRGIFCDGVGYGSALIANKINGCYAAVCQDPVCAALARQHTDSNVNKGEIQDTAPVGNFEKLVKLLILKSVLPFQNSQKLQGCHRKEWHTEKAKKR